MEIFLLEDDHKSRGQENEAITKILQELSAKSVIRNMHKNLL